MSALGYQLAPNVIDCADLGVPQNRIRLFLVCTRSHAPLYLKFPSKDHQPASSFVDFSAGNWSPILRPNRAAATLTRVANGRREHGERFVMPYYKSGSGLTGRSLNRPIGTITTIDRWAVVDGERMRMLTADECLAAQSFPADIARPESHRLTVHLAGNAVPPLAASNILKALTRAV